MPDQPSPKTIHVNGADFTYIDQGSGTPVIFVHGSLGDYRSWNAQLEPFSRKHRVIAYSRRYHFPNPPSANNRDYSAGLHANDLIGLIEAQGISPAFIVGNSFGAYTTLVAAIRRPDLVRKIAVGEPPILTWLQEIPGGKPYLEAFLQNAWQPATAAFASGSPEMGVAKFIEGVGGAGAWEHLPPAGKERMLQNAPSLQAETSATDYFTPVTPEQVRGLGPKTLLLKGENSEKMFHLVVDRLAECMDGAQVVTIPLAAHSIPSGNPSVYNDTVLRFFDQP